MLTNVSAYVLISVCFSHFELVLECSFKRMEAMEKEEEKHGESQQLLFAFDHVDSSSLSVADHVVGGVEHLLAPPSHNDAFSMAFQQALFKQGKSTVFIKNPQILAVYARMHIS